MSTANPENLAETPARPALETIGSNPIEPEKDFYALVSEFWVNTLKNGRDALDDHIEGLSGAERQKAKQIREQVNQYLEQLEQQKRKGPMEKFMKVFAPLLTAFSIILAAVVPTPMTIAMATVAVAMFLEPLISKAAGQESLIDKGMSLVMQELGKHMSPAVAAVVTGIVVTVAIVLLTCGLSAGLSAMGTAFGSSSAGAAANAASRAAATGGQVSTAGASTETAKSLAQSMARAIGITPQHSRFEAVTKLTEYLETALYMAKAGMDIDLAVLNFQLAKALKNYGVEQAYIDELTSVIDLIWKDVNRVQQHMERLLGLLTELFKRESMNIRVA